MNNLKNTIALMGIAFVVGGIFVWILIVVLDAKLTVFEVGPAKFEIPTQPPIQQRNTTQVTVTTMPQKPYPTNTPMPTIAPTPDTRLFWDDFENTLRPEWGFMDNNYAVSNGKLAVDGGRLTSSVIGDSNWKNYRIRLLGLASYTFIVRLRIQDTDNYLGLGCWPNGGLVTRRCSFGRVIKGNWETIPGTSTEHQYTGWGSGDTTFPMDIEVEAQGDIYRFYINGAQQVRFVDTTYTTGGILFYIDGRIRLETFEVVSLP